MNMEDTPATGFDIHENRRAQTTVLTPSGSITFENCTRLREVLEEAAARAKPTVILDGRRIVALDSEALELLVEWHGRLDEAGGSLKLVSLNDTCADILTATRLVHVLNVYADIEHAISG